MRAATLLHFNLGVFSSHTSSRFANPRFVLSNRSPDATSHQLPFPGQDSVDRVCLGTGRVDVSLAWVRPGHEEEG